MFRRSSRILVALVLLVSGLVVNAGGSASASSVIFTSSSTWCDARATQWLAQTSPNITKAYINSPWGGGGAVRCDWISVTSYVDLNGVVTGYQQSGTTNYVYAPNSSGAYGNPGVQYNGACMAGPANPCSLVGSVHANGTGTTRSVL